MRSCIKEEFLPFVIGFNFSAKSHQLQKDARKKMENVSLLSSEVLFTFLYIKALISVGVLRLILFLSLLGFRDILLGTKSSLDVANITFTYCKIIWSE